MLISCIGYGCYDDVRSWDNFFCILLCYWLLLLMLDKFYYYSIIHVLYTIIHQKYSQGSSTLGPNPFVHALPVTSLLPHRVQLLSSRFYCVNFSPCWECYRHKNRIPFVILLMFPWEGAHFSICRDVFYLLFIKNCFFPASCHTPVCNKTCFRT